MKRTLKSATACLQAVIDVFRKSIGGRPFTMDEASTWAMNKNLYPVPQRGDGKEAFEEFASRLEAVEAEIAK